MKVEWSKTPVPLFLPKEWVAQGQQQTENSPPKCVYQYDAEQNLLKLVALDDSEKVVDILDPEDIIGVNVEINMSSLSEPRATAGTTTNPSAEEDRPSNAPPTDTLTDTQGHAVLTIYSYPREDPNDPPAKESSILRWCGMGKTNPKPRPTYKRPDETENEWKQWGPRYAFHRQFTVVANEDMGPLNALVKAIRQAAQLLPNNNSPGGGRGRALIMINPVSGGGKGEAMYDDTLSVLLEQADMEHDVCVTTHQGHAKERMMKGYKGATPEDSRDILEYTSLICVGGDGIVHEALQGIKSREDSKQVLEKVTVGIIGAGTGNGMAMSIARTSQQKSSVLGAAFLIAKGSTRSTDLSIYQTANNSYLSFLTFSWAMMSSIDIESEVIRFAGSSRFDLWGVWSILWMKSYRAKFSYLPPDKDDKKTDPTMPALSSELPTSKWVTEEDDFILMWASQVPDAAENAYNSPNSRLDDGVFQILVIRKKNTTRFAMVKMLLGLETGAHADVPQAEFIPCTAFRLEPITPSINDVDGEQVEEGPIQGKVMPSAMKVFCK